MAGQSGQPAGTAARAPTIETAALVAKGLAALASHATSDHVQKMFCVTEVESAAIRAAYESGGELSAAVEVRRLFPGIEDMANARRCARAIAGWLPFEVPVQPVKLKRKRGATE